LPPRAHDVLREYRVLAGLHGTAVPVPVPLAACPDPVVIGVPFIVMAALPGDALRSRTLPPALAAAPDAVRRGVGEQLVDVLVALRSVVPDDVGLGDLGPRSGYLTRQLTRWSGQLEHARVRPIPDLETARDWLQANRPPDADDPAAARVVHGDFKLDNALFTLDSHARLLGIVDWEMATLGDPLADLAWLIAFWRQADDPPPIGPVIARTTEIPGFATRDDLVRRYVAATGADVGYLRWFVVLALWKMAVLLEGHWARHVRGTAGAFDFGYLGEAGPELQRRIVAYARGERDSVV
jgi:aminoglycoside phosphotransferase (APT) family kinase protein